MRFRGAPWRPSGAVALVTGASSGIGRELVRLLAERGATVIAAARRESRLQEIAEELAGAPGRVQSAAGDVTDAAFREEIGQRVRREFGRLDLLVNNAGVGAIGPFAAATPERLRQVMEVNFFAPAELTRALIPLLRAGRRPVICNVGSVLGHRAVRDKSEYCASKFALHGWSDALRAELRPEGIQVTLVSPSTTRSEFFDSAIETPDRQASRSWGSMSSRAVAAGALRAIRRRRSEVILSPGGKALVWGDRLAPPLMNWLLAAKRASGNATDGEVGRTEQSGR